MIVRDDPIEQAMFRHAIELIEKRYPVGWGSAAVVRTEDNRYFTSIWLDTINDSVNLCVEAGAMCEAYKHGTRVTHCVCVARSDENSPYRILSPCGVCQERLRFWGKQVMVGVTSSERLTFVSLGEMQPHHWTEGIEDLHDYDHLIRGQGEDGA